MTSAALPLSSPGPAIKTALKPHQQQALSFILSREHDADSLQTARKYAGDKGAPRTYKLDGIDSLWEMNQQYSGQWKNRLSDEDEMSKHEPSAGIGCLLADEMGLGKTLTALATVAVTMDAAKEFVEGRSLDAKSPSPMNDIDSAPQSDLPRVKATLIICPANVVDHWGDEITRHWSGAVNYLTVRGKGKGKAVPASRKGLPPLMVYIHKDRRLETAERFEEVDIIISTFGTLRSEMTGPNECSPMTDVEFFRVIIDEAHHLGRSRNSYAHTLDSIRHSRLLLLSGTPIQHSLAETARIFPLLRIPGVSTQDDTLQHVVNPALLPNPNLESLRLLGRAFSLRRTRLDVDIDSQRTTYLPTTSVYITLELPSNSRRLYDKLVQSAPGRQAMTELEDEDEDEELGDDDVDAGETLECSAIVLQMRLRRLCVDPALLSKVTGEEIPERFSPKVLWLIEEFTDLSVLVPGSLQYDAQVLHTRRAETGETGRATDTLKSVVFSSWTASLDILARALDTIGVGYLRYDGSIPIASGTRAEILEKFRTEPQCQVLLATYGAGGEGISLVAASRVYLLDPHWNPSVEKQAVDRIRRYGQTKAVMIVRLIMKDSIETVMREGQARKLKLIEMIWGRDE